MKADLELVLTHDGEHWTVHNDELIAMGDSFETLDQELLRSIKQAGHFEEGSRIKVFMGFDGKPCGFNNRYFHRCISLDL